MFASEVGNTMKVAAIDCGTNSIRLLIAHEVDGVLVDDHRLMEVVRLGEGVDRTGEFSSAALERTFAAATKYGEIIKREGVDRIRFCATSASRDARNRDLFINGINEILGVTPEVIPGEEEARLSFLGATSGRTDGPFLVVDIGGGSTEFVVGTTSVEAAISVDIGCVRMTERHMSSDPIKQDEIAAATSDIDRAISRAMEVVPVASAHTLIAVAGTATTVAAAALGLTSYQPNRIHGSVISLTDVQKVSDQFLVMNRSQRAALPYMHPGRVDVIAAGSLVLRRILERCNFTSFVASEHDILDGIAASLTR